MLTFDEQTGNILIDFADNLTVTVRPPKYGALKRLRRERERLADEARAEATALPEIPPAGDTEGVDDAVTRARLGRERVAAIETINLAAAEKFWRFVLIGDDTFAGLADPAPPEDVDDWPAGLLFDTHNQLTELGLTDRVFAHWGKVPSRSGPSA